MHSATRCLTTKIPRSATAPMCWPGPSNAAVPTAAAETNPLARGVMHRLGVRRTAAVVFVVAAMLTCAVAAVVLMMESTLYAACFVVVGLFDERSF